MALNPSNSGNLEQLTLEGLIESNIGVFYFYCRRVYNSHDTLAKTGGKMAFYRTAI